MDSWGLRRNYEPSMTHAAPSPLLRMALPLLVFVPFAVAGLFGAHPRLALECSLLPAAVACPAMLLARRWWETFALLFTVVVGFGFVGAAAYALGS